MTSKNAVRRQVVELNTGTWLIIACCVALGALAGAGVGARLQTAKSDYLQSVHAPFVWGVLGLAATLLGVALCRRVAALQGAQRTRAGWILLCAAVLSMCFGAGGVVVASAANQFALVLVAGALFGLWQAALLGRSRATALWLVPCSMLMAAVTVTLYRLVMVEYWAGTDEIVSGALAAAVGGVWVGVVAARSMPTT